MVVVALALAFCAVVLGDEPTSRAAPPTHAEALAILRPPAGSLSVGTPANGRLERAVRVPLRGRSYRFLPRVAERRTNYGTGEMASLLRSVSDAVASRYPGSIMGVGNIGARQGGAIAWSVTHQSGRDVDIAPYVLHTRSGEPAQPDLFVPFGPDGRHAGSGLRFDAARNLALVVALLEEEETPVRRILLAEWLKKLLLRRARAEGLPPERVGQIEQIVQQPWLSSPHDDHLHVRIACPSKDRPHGCRDNAPPWPWSLRYGADVRRRVSDLVRVLEMSSRPLRLRALEQLRSIGDEAATPALLDLLRDPDEQMRWAALRALRAIDEPAAFSGLVAELRGAREPRWAHALLRAALRLEGEASVRLAIEVLRTPEAVLAGGLRSGAHLHGLQTEAIPTLAHLGDREAGAALVEALSSPSAGVRKAAGDALISLTGRRPAGADPVKAWKRFLAESGRRSRADWLRQALEAGGHVPRGLPPLCPDVVSALVAAVGSRDVLVSHTASRLLSAQSGFAVDPRRRSRHSLHRLWKVFWRMMSERLGREEPVRQQRLGLERA